MKIRFLVVTLLLIVSVATEAAWVDRELMVLEVTNQQRSINGIAALRGDNRLREAAFGHSQAMSANDFFDHDNPITGSRSGDRITDAGYRWIAQGENIAAGQGYDFVGFGIEEFEPLAAARAVMFGTTNLNDFISFDTNITSWAEVGNNWTGSNWDAWGKGWMGSTVHRNNILNGLFTDLGVGYVWEPGDATLLRTYWTQNFATGDSMPVQPVPLPAGIWLFGSACVAGIGLLRRRKAA